MTSSVTPSVRPDSALGELLRRHNLILEPRNLAQRGAALVHVARDQDGRRRVIKDGGRRYGGDEHAWLSAHASHPGVVDVLDELDGLLLLSWVPGSALDELPLGAAHFARAAGELLASLERAPDPNAAGLARRITAAGQRLPARSRAASSPASSGWRAPSPPAQTRVAASGHTCTRTSIRAT